MSLCHCPHQTRQQYLADQAICPLWLWHCFLTVLTLLHLFLCSHIVSVLVLDGHVILLDGHVILLDAHVLLLDSHDLILGGHVLLLGFIRLEMTPTRSCLLNSLSSTSIPSQQMRPEHQNLIKSINDTLILTQVLFHLNMFSLSLIKGSWMSSRFFVPSSPQRLN